MILNRHCLLIFGYFKLCLLILVVCRIPAFCYSLKNLDGLWGNWAVTVNCLCALSGEASDSNPAWDTWWGCHLLAIWYFLVLSPDQCHRRDVQSADLSDQEHKVEDQELWSRQSGLLALPKQPGMHIHPDNNSVNSSSHHCDSCRHHHHRHCHYHWHCWPP